MNKNYGFFLVISMFCSTGLSFGAAIQQDRYEEIIKAFSVETGTFNQQFVPSGDDINIVIGHKNVLQNQLAQKKKIFQESYKPMLWLVASGMFFFRAVKFGFSSDTVVQTTRYEKIVEHRTREMWHLGSQFIMPLALVAAARYSFEQMMSYNNEVVVLQQNISCHGSIINALGAL